MCLSYDYIWDQIRRLSQIDTLGWSYLKGLMYNKIGVCTTQRQGCCKGEVSCLSYTLGWDKTP